jgi:hypothetical protein
MWMTNGNFLSPKGIDLNHPSVGALWTIDLRLNKIYFSVIQESCGKGHCEEIVEARKHNISHRSR